VLDIPYIDLCLRLAETLEIEYYRQSGYIDDLIPSGPPSDSERVNMLNEGQRVGKTLPPPARPTPKFGDPAHDLALGAAVLELMMSTFKIVPHKYAIAPIFTYLAPSRLIVPRSEQRFSCSRRVGRGGPRVLQNRQRHHEGATLPKEVGQAASDASPAGSGEQGHSSVCSRDTHARQARRVDSGEGRRPARQVTQFVPGVFQSARFTC
jgi:hypothetical protein